MRPDDGKAWSLKRIHALIVTSAAYRNRLALGPGRAVDAEIAALGGRRSGLLEAEA